LTRHHLHLHTAGVALVGRYRLCVKIHRDSAVGVSQKFLRNLKLREQVMVMLAGSTGLRRSEMFALRWSDVDFQKMEVAVTKSCVRGRFGKVKTAASGKPVPLHHSVYALLLDWRRESPYRKDEDFLFPSVRLNGDKPLTPDMVLKRVIRPALIRAGISKVIGWHSFRHSLATNLRTMGVDVKGSSLRYQHEQSSAAAANTCRPHSPCRNGPPVLGEHERKRSDFRGLSPI
jgi:integrase